MLEILARVRGHKIKKFAHRAINSMKIVID